MAKARNLTMKFAGRFIDLLGQQMYGGPVPAVAELIANAWDADADKVEVHLPEDPKADGAVIIVRDYGIGMTFEEVNEFYLSLGYERRGRGDRTAKKRLVMGRKGIGKLAGFGIAENLVIRSVKDGHLVQFTLNYTSLRKRKILDGFAIAPEIDEASKEPSGVTVTFQNLKYAKRIDVDDFRRRMGRRFALQTDRMSILVNRKPLSKDALDFEHRIPAKVGEWEEEDFPQGKIKYWFGFLKSPIDEPELRGISIFARERTAQMTPFFFNLSGGINGQVGLEYLTGQLKADFLDESEDCIATDRQTVNWQFETARALEEWGQKKLKELCNDWKKRRRDLKTEAFRHDYSDLFERIEHLPSQEREDVITSLDRIADIERIDEKDFQVIAVSLLAGVERESVKKIIRKINAADDKALAELVTAVKEWDIISAVSTAEVVAGKIEIINKFQALIQNRTKEKAPKGQIDMQSFVRDYPWLLGQQFEHLMPAEFHHEHGVDKWIEEVLQETDKEYRREDEKEGKRFDLLCIKNDHQVVILELMRPGEPADYDHVMRLNRYVTRIETAIQNFGSASDFRGKTVFGLLIADKLDKDPSLSKTLQNFRQTMDTITWEGLLKTVKARYKDFFAVLKQKAPEDPRIKGLVTFVNK
jgi:hypothetical protein